MSKRGRGACPMCQHQYANKYKPEHCECGAYLGGKYAPKQQKKTPAPDAVEIINNVFSTKTSSRNDRCLVTREGLQWICLHAKCLKDRATFVSSGNAEGFACKHINQAKNGNVCKPLDHWTPKSTDIDQYEAGQMVQADMRKVVDGLNPSTPAVITVCEDRFLVYGPPTATNTMGYSHVRKEEAALFCVSRDCKTCVAYCKSEKQKDICIHLHLLLLYNKVTHIGYSAKR